VRNGIQPKKQAAVADASLRRFCEGNLHGQYHVNYRIIIKSAQTGPFSIPLNQPGRVLSCLSLYSKTKTVQDCIKS